METATIIQQVMDWLKNVGTFVVENGWRIAMRQVYYYGIMDLIAALVFLILGIIFLPLFKEANKRDDEWDTPVPFLFLLGMVISFLVFLICGLSSIHWFINPEWYAIKLIIEQVK